MLIIVPKRKPGDPPPRVTLQTILASLVFLAAIAAVIALARRHWL